MVKIKKIMSKGDKDDTDLLNKMFQQMTGMEGAETEIIIPKIINITQNVVKFIKLYSLLLSFKEFTDTFSDYKEWFDDIEEFIKKLKDIDELNANIDYNKLEKDELNSLYKKLKENSHIKNIVITGSNLSKYKAHLEKVNNIDGSFINREPGMTMKPLSFSNMDLKILWYSDYITDQSKKYVLSILSHTYKISMELYKIITSPDIDIKRFSQILVKSIAKLKKQIPRCDEAFAVLENSVSLLENNFSSYYKSSVEAENPNFIIESFIIDVSTTQKSSSKVTTQFRRIVNYLRQKSSGTNDPKVKQLFKMLNNNFSMMDGKPPSPEEDPTQEPEPEQETADEPLASENNE